VVYFAETPLDKIIPFEISWSGGVVDTLEIPFFSEALEGGSKLKFNVGKQHVAGQSVTITSSDWIIPSIDRVVLMEDSTKVDAYLDADEVRINHFNLRPALRSGKQYTLTVLPGAFVNLAGQPCDTSVVSFRTYEPDDLGKIILTLNHGEDPQHLVLELSGPEGVVARKTSLETGTILGLKDLVPGNYTARIFDDANGNDRWDPGDYEKKIQPERTWILPQTMNVRANREVQVPWDF